LTELFYGVGEDVGVVVRAVEGVVGRLFYPEVLGWFEVVSEN
jgi:hypothetical protein